jgi:hypothetical protein
MLIHLPVISSMLGAGVDPMAATTDSADLTPAITRFEGRAAQVRLADVLGDADAVESVIAKSHVVAFEYVRGGETFEAIARTRHGELVTLDIRDAGPALGWDGTDDGVERGGLAWLGDIMKETVAITRLDVDRDGAVTLVTTDGQKYMAIPGRGSGGSNEAVEARRAAQWDRG